MNITNPCSKVSYSSKKFADNDLRRIFKESKRTKIPVRSYECPKCKTWHLTSSESFSQSYFQKLVLKIKEIELENKNLKSNQNKENSVNEVIKAKNKTILLKDKKIKEQRIIISELIAKNSII